MSHSDHGVSSTAWREFLARHANGGTIEGVVVSVVPFGAFIEVAEGIHGMLPRADWPGELEPGAGVPVRINQIDIHNRRMSLLPA